MAAGDCVGKGPRWGLGIPQHRGTLKGSGLFPRGWESYWVGSGVFNQKELKSPWAKPQDKHCARDLPHLLSLILSTASETRSLLLILQVRKMKLREVESYAQGHKASRQQTQHANSDKTSTQLSLLHPTASHSE